MTNVYLNRFLHTIKATVSIMPTTTAITGPTIAATGGLLSLAAFNGSAAEIFMKHSFRDVKNDLQYGIHQNSIIHLYKVQSKRKAK